MKKEVEDRYNDSLRKELDRIEFNIKNKEVSLNIIEKENLLEILKNIRKKLKI